MLATPRILRLLMLLELQLGSARAESASSALAAAAVQPAPSSPNFGLNIEIEARLGEACLVEGREAEARQHLETAVNEWLSARALNWIRSLPNGDDSNRAIERARDAASAARLSLADLNTRRSMIPLKPFHGLDAKLPFAKLPDSALSAQQRRQREIFRKRYDRDLLVYMQRVLAPWAKRQQESLRSAELEYERILLMPPRSAPRFRVAFYARVGALWWSYVQALRAPSRARLDVFGLDAEYVHYSSFGEPGETEEYRARRAFEACVAVSRKHHLLSSDTLDCEEWLGTHYRSMYSRFGELTPYPDMPTPADPFGRARPNAR